MDESGLTDISPDSAQFRALIVRHVAALSVRYLDTGSTFVEQVQQRLRCRLPRPLEAIEWAETGSAAKLTMAWRSPTETLVLGGRTEVLSGPGGLPESRDGWVVDMTGAWVVIRCQPSDKQKEGGLRNCRHLRCAYAKGSARLLLSITMQRICLPGSARQCAPARLCQYRRQRRARGRPRTEQRLH